MNKAITTFLTEHADTNPVSFHMPGHKGSRIYRENGYGYFLDKIMDCDITEIPGADNLFQTEGIIAETMKKYERLYGVKKSYLLVNGSSGGLISAILACVRPGGKLIMARNSHKSIFNALGLASIEPVYAYPEEAEGCGILGEITAEEIVRCMDDNPDADAVILPSPNYYGICSNVRKIAEEVHKRGKVLIVDQAHGAHLRLFEKYAGSGAGCACAECGFPESAETQGADIVINSIHKTLASFTQSALLNLTSDRVNPFVMEDKLQTIESSSPSYLLMATLDINADLLEKSGERLIKEWTDNLEYFYTEAEKIPGLRVIMPQNMDRTKINIDMSAYGINGNELEELLMERDIFIELVTGNIVMCMTGIGNTRRDYERLIESLKEIAAKLGENKAGGQAIRPAGQPEVLTRVLEKKAVPVEKEFVLIDEAAGRVCGSSIIPYPPGIPIVCPGEVIDEAVIEYVKARRGAGEKVIGLTAEDTVCVGRQV
ncbi:MAG: hypothetical protein MST07_09505 [Firmicutes bacterium]|nr:hypothetical protein [Bacillota bacterium]